MLKTVISYNRVASEALSRRFPQVFGVSVQYHAELIARIKRCINTFDRPNILEVGGIDRPLLSKNDKYFYDGLDIQSKQQCLEIYDHFIVQSIEEPISQRYDVIISRTLLEHVPNNKASVKNMFASLKYSGQTHHYIPSKWHPYSVALRIIGPRLQKKLIPMLRPAAIDVTGYPAYFDHCSVNQMKSMFLKAGFTKIDIMPVYRANDYFAFFVPFYIVVSFFENICRVFDLTLFCSGFIISAERPAKL
jgi:hypothetical protein